MKFEWSENKNRTNKKKHGISFEVAKLIFDDPCLISVLDKRFDEERWYSIGSSSEIMLFVAHTVEVNENGEEIIRIISARKAQKSERERYLQNYP